MARSSARRPARAAASSRRRRRRQRHPPARPSVTARSPDLVVADPRSGRSSGRRPRLPPCVRTDSKPRSPARARIWQLASPSASDERHGEVVEHRVERNARQELRRDEAEQSRVALAADAREPFGQGAARTATRRSTATHQEHDERDEIFASCRRGTSRAARVKKKFSPRNERTEATRPARRPPSAAATDDGEDVERRRPDVAARMQRHEPSRVAADDGDDDDRRPDPDAGARPGAMRSAVSRSTATTPSRLHAPGPALYASLTRTELRSCMDDPAPEDPVATHDLPPERRASRPCGRRASTREAADPRARAADIAACTTSASASRRHSRSSPRTTCPRPPTPPRRS